MSEINKAITGVMADISKTGIAKSTRNLAQGFNYRGIDAAMNELNPLLVAHGITVTPRYSELNVTERAKEGGKATRFVTIKGAFTFSVKDGSNVVSECYGEAMDSGDKAVVKAQTVAFRTALFQQFVVPTVAIDPEVDEDDLPAFDVEAALKDVAECKDGPSLQTVWEARAAEAVAAQDRAGHKKVKDAVMAKLKTFKREAE